MKVTRVRHSLHMCGHVHSDETGREWKSHHSSGSTGFLAGARDQRSHSRDEAGAEGPGMELKWSTGVDGVNAGLG